MGHPPEFAEWRRERPIRPVSMADGQRVWLVSTHELAKTVLADGRFSSNVFLPGYPTDGVAGHVGGEFSRSMIRMDAPDHTRLRRLVTREFMPKRIEHLKPTIREVVDSSLDAMEENGSPVDFVSTFAAPVPGIVIDRMLGVPEEDHAFFQDSANALVTREIAPAASLEVQRELGDYIRQLVVEKQRKPEGEDLFTKLVHHRDENGEGLTTEELASFGVLLIAGGHDTTMNQLSLSMLTLLKEPALRKRLELDPSQWPRAVNELLRFWAIVRSGPRRVATEDVEVGGQMIRRGEGVVVSIWSANHDETVFPAPGTVDIERGGPPHVAFGFGVHQCIGQSVARLELTIALPAVLQRFPTISLAREPRDEDFRRDMSIYGLYELEVMW